MKLPIHDQAYRDLIARDTRVRASFNAWTKGKPHKIDKTTKGIYALNLTNYRTLATAHNAKKHKNQRERILLITPLLRETFIAELYRRYEFDQLTQALRSVEENQRPSQSVDWLGKLAQEMYVYERQIGFLNAQGEEHINILPTHSDIPVGDRINIQTAYAQAAANKEPPLTGDIAHDDLLSRRRANHDVLARDHLKLADSYIHFAELHLAYMGAVATSNLVPACNMPALIKDPQEHFEKWFKASEKSLTEALWHAHNYQELDKMPEYRVKLN